MCFSVNVNIVKEELENRFGATIIDRDKYRPSYYYHAFGLPEIPALCSGNPGKISLLKWGLIPSWVKSSDDADVIRFKTFNARSESISEKPSFSSSFRSKRCIIPINGFFEWQHVGKEKIPWYIYQSDNEILSVAGLYDSWSGGNNSETLNTFSIITTEANDLMSEIHNSGKRMPAILERTSENIWVDLNTPLSEIQKLLKPCSPDVLKAHTIGPLVNDRTANRNTPDVIKPFDYYRQNLLF